MGDINRYIGLSGEKINKNSELLIELMDEICIDNLNEIIAEVFCIRNQESANDYMLMNGKMWEIVGDM